MCLNQFVIITTLELCRALLDLINLKIVQFLIQKVRINLTKTICFLQIQLVFHQLVFAVLLIAVEALGRDVAVQ